MKFLQEIMVDVRRLDAEEDREDDLELSLDDDMPLDLEDDPEQDPDEQSDLELSLDDETEPTEDQPEGFDGPEPDFDGPDLSGGFGGSGGSVGGTDSELSIDEEPPVDGDEEDTDQLDGIANTATEDPNRQGLIRAVKNAHLVYKRETEEGTFEELWIYNVADFRSEINTKKAILAGTDIPPNKTRSPDGSQTYTTWAAGNAEMLLIRGLPN